MQIRSLGEMGTRFAASKWLLAILLVAATVASSASAPPFVVLTQPFKIKIKYGETVLPAGMKLEVVSSDAATVQVVFMGDIQTIPRDIVQFEGASSSPIAPTNPPRPSPARSAAQQPTVSLTWGWDSPMQGGNITIRELESLLSNHCTPAVDLAAMVSIFTTTCAT